MAVSMIIVNLQTILSMLKEQVFTTLYTLLADHQTIATSNLKDQMEIKMILVITIKDHHQQTGPEPHIIVKGLDHLLFRLQVMQGYQEINIKTKIKILIDKQVGLDQGKDHKGNKITMHQFHYHHYHVSYS